MEQEQTDKDTSITTISADPAHAPSEGGGDGELGAQVSCQTKKKSKKGYWGEFTAQPVEVLDGEVVKRKRKKTRSKQKNIRKDSRPDDEKPNYRPLTSATLAKKAQRH